MKNQAFTLIEVLIVVLIIAILAAIAVPQYQKIVLRSKLSTLKSNVRTIFSSVQYYYMLHNTYPNNISELDIELAAPSGSYYYTGSGNVGGIINNSKSIHLLNYYIDYRGRAYCIAYDGTESGHSESTRLMLKDICQKETGKTKRDWGTDISQSAYEYE